MKTYGIGLDMSDVDINGSATNGRATAVYAVGNHGGDAHALHSLRRGKKARVRRPAKRRERLAGKLACTADAD